MGSKGTKAMVLRWALLAAIVAFAAFLRLYGIGTQSLWLDEGVSLRIARLDVPGIFREVRVDNNPPLYYLLLHYWIELFGDSETSVRMPSALAGVLAVLAIYGVGSRLLLERPAALLAALMLAAVVPFHLRYSQEARTYELMLTLSLVSFYFFVGLCREEGRDGSGPVAQTGYVLCTSLLMYSHVYGLFVVLAQNLYVFALAPFGAEGARAGRRPRLDRWVVLQGALLILYAPGLALLYEWVTSPGQRGWVEEPTVRSVYKAFVSYAGSPTLLVLLAVLCGVAAFSLARRAPAKLLLLSFWLVIPLAVPICVSLVSTPIFSSRYAISATPALYLLACLGVQAMVQSLSRSWARGIAYAAASILMATLAAGNVLAYYEEPNKPQWREAATYVEARAEPGDLAVVAPGYQADFVLGHHLDDPNVSMLPYGSRDLRTSPTREDLLRTVRQAYQSDRVWLVVATDEASVGQVRKVVLNKLFVGTEERRYEGVTVKLFQKRPPS